MPVEKEDQIRPAIELLLTSGGMNSNVGEALLKDNESPYSRNFDFLQGGGLGFGYNGFQRKVCSLPYPVRKNGLFVRYDKRTGRRQHFAYAPPCLFRIDINTNSFEKSKGAKFPNSGAPIVTSFGCTTVLFDGANVPHKTENGILWEQFDNWPPTHTRVNEDDLANPNAAQTVTDWLPPQFGIFHSAINRLALNLPAFPSAFAISKPRLYDDFRLNVDPDVGGLDIGAEYEMAIKGGVTGLGSTPNFLVVYGRDGIGTLSGTNPDFYDTLHPNGGAVQDPLTFKTVVSGIGLLSPFLLAKRGNADSWFWSEYGLYTLSTSESFQTVKPNLASFPIQNLINELGTEALIKRSFLYNDLHNGVLYLIAPVSKRHLTRGRMYKLNYLTNDNRETDKSAQMVWNIQDGFGDYFNIDGMCEGGSDTHLIASGTDIWLMGKGTSYDGRPIVAEHYIKPQHFSFPDHTKKIFRYRIRYESPTGAWLKIYHSWEDGTGGVTKVYLPATGRTSFGLGKGGFSTDGSGGHFNNSASGRIFTVNPEVVGKKEGRIYRGRLKMESSTAQCKIYNCWLSHEVLGIGHG